MAEVVVSGVIGYLWGLVGQIVMFPLFDVHLTIHQNLTISLLFIVWGAAKSYAVRRFFNHLHSREV